MKNWRCKFLIITLGCVLAVLAVKYLPSLLRSEANELYRRYEHCDGVKVGFVKDFRINDSVTADITVITAKDSVAWEALQRDFGIPEEFIEANRTAKQRGTMNMTSFHCEKGHPEKRVAGDDKPFDVVYYSSQERAMYIYDITEKNKKHTFDIQLYEDDKLYNNE